MGMSACGIYIKYCRLHPKSTSMADSKSYWDTHKEQLLCDEVTAGARDLTCSLKAIYLSLGDLVES